MRNLGIAAIVIGAISVMIGLILTAAGLADGRTLPGALAQRDGTVLIWMGGAAMLLGGILTTLVDMLQELRKLPKLRDTRGASSTVAPPGRGPATYVHPDPAPRRPAIPTRFDMQQRHGEALGNRAWALMDSSAKQGAPLAEAVAVQMAREQAQTGHD